VHFFPSQSYEIAVGKNINAAKEVGVKFIVFRCVGIIGALGVRFEFKDIARFQA
jgi:hypothetical protein